MENIAQPAKAIRFALPALTIIAAVFFLLGVGSSILLLNEIERVRVFGTSTSLNVKESLPNTAVEALMRALTHRTENLPLTVDGESVELACGEVSELEVLSISEVYKATEDSAVQSGTDLVTVENSAVVLTTNDASTRTFEVDVLVTCADGNQVVASGFPTVTVSDAGLFHVADESSISF
jgi:hypothetical protein